MKKYQVIVNGDGSPDRHYPFRSQFGIERKFLWIKWIEWHSLDIHKTINEAIIVIAQDKRKLDVEEYKVGQVVYDESDFLVDKLKGNVK